MDKKLTVQTKDKFSDLNKRLDTDVSNKLQELATSRDGILQSISDTETFTLTPLQATQATMKEHIEALNEKIKELEEKANDSKKVDKMMDALELSLEG